MNIGRNDDCWCGSNKKYKKCHMKFDEKLEEMKNTVDQKLQKTLEDKISQSFKLVSERLEQVYKGLGEMNWQELLVICQISLHHLHLLSKK